MARKQIRYYVFTPGGVGTGTVKFSGTYEKKDILVIYNTTDNINIYNFSDSGLGGTVTTSQAVDSDFSESQDGVTTVTLDYNTSSMSAGDELLIYVENQEFTIIPYAFGVDAVERMRVSNPEALLDADFEYGLQNTKWQSVVTVSDRPGLYEFAGSDLRLPEAGYVTHLAADNTIGATDDTSIALSNQETGDTPWANNDYALLTTVSGTSNYTTGPVSGATGRTFSVASTTGFTAGDYVIMYTNPDSGDSSFVGSTVATNITSTGTTSVVLASGTGFSDGDYIMVQTDTSNVYEVMAVSGVSVDTLTVTRQVNGSNDSGANITSANTVRRINKLEIGKIFSVDSATQLTINRGQFNTEPLAEFSAGTVIAEMTTSREIVKMTSTSRSVNGSQTISRGQVGTSPLSSAGVGSLLIYLTGVFDNGNSDLPQVGIHISAHGLAAESYISVQELADTDANGRYFIHTSETNYFFYYPKKATGLLAGDVLNTGSTSVRQAGRYTGSALNLADTTPIASDGETPSTITVTTKTAHGLQPGNLVLVQLNSATNEEYAEGSFAVLTIPTPTTFTYQAKSGAAVSGTLTGTITVKDNTFFVHRPFDGGVSLGTGTPSHGSLAARQSRKYFRYQSGKGLVFSTGSIMCPTFDITTLSSDSTGVGEANITVVLDRYHGLNAGATVNISGIVTSGWNGDYVVESIVSDTSFIIEAQAALDSTQPELGSEARVTVKNWYGASVQLGMFDDQNGTFFEYDGVSVNVVKRRSTLQIAGTVSVEADSTEVTGDGDCRFTEQCKVSDQITVRGMTHTIQQITDNNTMTISPAFRGRRNQQYVKLTLIEEQRIPQSKWNIDKCDGTGPTGFVFDVTKMQMFFIEYTWYGAGYIQYGMRGQGGKYLHCHRIKNNNVNFEAYMRSGNTPVKYAVTNTAGRSRLNGDIEAGSTTLTIDDATHFPSASVSYPVHIGINNEVIRYTGKTGNQLTGLTRSATLSQWSDGALRSFTKGSGAAHADGDGVYLIGNTCTPTVSHWGSALIMDGGFQTDRGYNFSINVQNFSTSGSADRTIIIMRLAPSVSNSIVGDIGDRDLVNKAQLLLNFLRINVTGRRYLVTGELNSTNIDAENTQWQGLDTEDNGFQPSFVQYADPNQIAFTDGGIAATGGERVFAIPVNTTNSGTLDLSQIKELAASAIPGRGVYPDGPEVLAINIRPTVRAGSGTCDVQISFQETQA